MTFCNPNAWREIATKTLSEKLMETLIMDGYGWVWIISGTTD